MPPSRTTATGSNYDCDVTYTIETNLLLGTFAKERGPITFLSPTCYLYNLCIGAEIQLGHLNDSTPAAKNFRVEQHLSHVITSFFTSNIATVGTLPNNIKKFKTVKQVNINSALATLNKTDQYEAKTALIERFSISGEHFKGIIFRITKICLRAPPPPSSLTSTPQGIVNDKAIAEREFCDVSHSQTNL